jgi:predicted transcriptional regulator
MADSTFTFRVDEELKAAFAEIAAAQEHTAAQLLRVLMRDAVQRWHESQEHDTWFRSEVSSRGSARPTIQWLIASPMTGCSRAGGNSGLSWSGAQLAEVREGRMAA